MGNSSVRSFTERDRTRACRLSICRMPDSLPPSPNISIASSRNVGNKARPPGAVEITDQASSPAMPLPGKPIFKSNCAELPFRYRRSEGPGSEVLATRARCRTPGCRAAVSGDEEDPASGCKSHPGDRYLCERPKADRHAYSQRRFYRHPDIPRRQQALHFSRDGDVPKGRDTRSD